LQDYHIYTLLIITFGAFIVPIFAPFFKLPGAVAEMLYGMIIGKSLLNVIDLSHNGQWLKFMADFGFIILMFLAGLEIDFGDFKKKGLKTLSFPIFSFIISAILGFFIIRFLKMNIALFFIVIATGIGLLIPVLKDLNLEKKKFGNMLFLLGLTAELLTLLIFTFFEIYQLHGLSIRVLQMPLMIFISIIFLKTLHLISWWYPEKVINFIHPKDSKEIGIRMSFILMFTLVAIALLFHIEFIIGALIAGMVISATFKEKGALEEKMNAIGYGFFIPIFFINIGINFNIKSILEKETFYMFLNLMAIAFIIKLVSSLPLLFQGFKFRNVIATSFMLSAPLTLLVAIGMIELKLGLITAKTNNAIIFLAIVTGVLYPIFFKVFYKEQNELS
jgi:Kef-type K+ transport system membrane component KefB